jgi:hypothetical protein
MKVVVTGGRDNTDIRAIWATLDEIHALHPITMLVWGGARGADTIASRWADARKVNHMLVSAKWNEHGRAAGFIRNREMLELSGVDMLIAFHGGRGTAHTVKTAREMGIHIWHQEKSHD